jgi:hypothetical protein
MTLPDASFFLGWLCWFANNIGKNERLSRGRASQTHVKTYCCG